MSESTVFVKRYTGDDSRFAVNEQEILRYAGYPVKDMDEELRHLLDQVREELLYAFSYQVCYRRMEITWQEDQPLLPFSVTSQDLAKCLRGSREIILFAATVGLEIDRYIARYQRISETKALLLQAYGAERVECLCNAFCQEIKEEEAAQGGTVTARFSPGYGDLPLQVQKDVFRLLDCNRQIGISLNDSLLMTPSKSVTALFGIRKEHI